MLGLKAMFHGLPHHATAAVAAYLTAAPLRHGCWLITPLFIGYSYAIAATPYHSYAAQRRYHISCYNIDLP
jgi:hypothetical protein